MTFNPSEQRDQTGKWTAGGGQPQPPIEPVTPPPIQSQLTTEQVRERADAIAKEMNFDPARIDISEEAPTFMLNGKQYNTGGIAQVGEPEGLGRIVLYRPALTGAVLDGVIVHEIEHMKFQSVLNRESVENSLIMNEPGLPADPEHKYWWGKKGGIETVMAPNGSLRGDYPAKYPVYSAMQEVFHKYGPREFAKTDGVTPYSYDWWKAWADNTTGSYQAVHETLAEMARVKYETGKFPEHMGPRVLEYRAKLNRDLINKPDFDGDVPKMTKGEIAKGTKIWRELYRTVEKFTK